DFRVVRPRAVILRAGAADQHAALLVEDREHAEAVLLPVALPARERLLGLRARQQAGQRARVELVRVPARDGVEVAGLEPSEEQALRLDHRSASGRRTSQPASGKSAAARNATRHDVPATSDAKAIGATMPPKP